MAEELPDGLNQEEWDNLSGPEQEALKEPVEENETLTVEELQKKTDAGEGEPPAEPMAAPKEGEVPAKPKEEVKDPEPVAEVETPVVPEVTPEIAPIVAAPAAPEPEIDLTKYNVKPAQEPIEFKAQYDPQKIEDALAKLKADYDSGEEGISLEDYIDTRANLKSYLASDVALKKQVDFTNEQRVKDNANVWEQEQQIFQDAYPQYSAKDPETGDFTAEAKRTWGMLSMVVNGHPELQGNKSSSGLQKLVAAHKIVSKMEGLTPAAPSKEVIPPKPAPGAKPVLPTDLGGVPAAENFDTTGGKHSALDKLTGQKSEYEVSKMSEAELDEWCQSK